MKKRYIVLIIVMIIAPWSATWYFVPKIYHEPTLGAGTFGDMFGAVNALFSGLAFAGLIYTIAIQRQELHEQQKSINNQQRDAEEAAIQSERQRKMMNFQIEKSILDNLIASKNELKRTARSNDGDGGFAGNEFFKLFMNSRPVSLYNGNFMMGYSALFFDIVQYILNSDLDNDQKDNLKKILIINTTTEEIKALEYFSKNNQHRMFLLSHLNIKDVIGRRENHEYGIK